MQLESVRLYLSADPISVSTPRLLFGPHGQGLATTSPAELGIDPLLMAEITSGPGSSLFGTVPGGTISWGPLTP
jgi:hypothetical protein